jgi:hypothetical protein
MSITIHPELEAKLRARAQAEGMTVEAYLERLVRAEQSAEDELAALVSEGLNSGEPIEAGPGYGEAKHQKPMNAFEARAGSERSVCPLEITFRYLLRY